MIKLDATKRLLAEEAMGRAERISARYSRIFPEFEADLKSCAYWGAVRAASEYTPDRNVIWQRWSAMFVKREISRFFASTWPRRHARYAKDDMNAVEDGRSEVDPVGSTDLLDWLLGHLTERQRELCSLVYKHGLTPAEAGRSLGLAGYRGCDIHREAIQRLRAALAKPERTHPCTHKHHIVRPHLCDCRCT